MRWFETRSAADLDAALAGLACPVVVIDLGRDPVGGLSQLGNWRGNLRPLWCSCSIPGRSKGSGNSPGSSARPT